MRCALRGFDWRGALASMELQCDLMLAETTEQLIRRVSSACIVQDLLQVARDDPTIAREVREYVDSCIQGAKGEALGWDVMPLCCSAYVLANLGDVESLGVVERLSKSKGPEIGWACRFVGMLLLGTGGGL